MDASSHAWMHVLVECVGAGKHRPRRCMGQRIAFVMMPTAFVIDRRVVAKVLPYFLLDR